MWKASEKSAIIWSTTSPNSQRQAASKSIAAAVTTSMRRGRTIRSSSLTNSLTLDLNMSIINRSLIVPSSFSLRIAAIFEITTSPRRFVKSSQSL